MAKSGMRYQKMLNLVSKMEEYQTRMTTVMDTLQNERSTSVAAVYGGEAADNFKTNMKTIADNLDKQIKSIIKQLNEEAQTQHDNYQKQEAALKSGPAAATD